MLPWKLAKIKKYLILVNLFQVNLFQERFNQKLNWNWKVTILLHQTLLFTLKQADLHLDLHLNGSVHLNLRYISFVTLNFDLI